MSSIFADLDGSEWFYQDAVKAHALGLLGGFPDGTFRPDESLTRAQAASIIRRLVEAANRIESLETRLLLDRITPTVARVVVPGKGTGSGVWVRPDGWMVTCAHVVGDAKTAIVMWPSAVDWPAEVVVTYGDLALLKVSSAPIFPAATLAASSALEAGETVYAVGNTLGMAIRTTRGTVARDDQYTLGYTVNGEMAQHQVLDHTAAIAPGNSGGGLFDVNGHLVGITNAGMPSAQNFAFAITVEAVRELLAGRGVEV